MSIGVITIVFPSIRYCISKNIEYSIVLSKISRVKVRIRIMHAGLHITGVILALLGIVLESGSDKYCAIVHCQDAIIMFMKFNIHGNIYFL